MTVRIPEICVAGDAPGAGADLVFTAEIRRVGVKSGAPPGFDAGPWVALREGRARVALAALWGDPVVVDAVRLDEISLEIQHGPKGTNYGTILEARSAAAIPSAGGPRFQVRDLIARDVTVRVREDLAVVAIPLTLRVPEVHLRDIGKETERGVILGQLHDIVIRAILEAILGTDVRTIPADFVRDFRAILADVGGTAAAAGKPAAEDTPASDLKRAGEHAGGLLQELGGDAVKTFKDAFDSGSK
jgi:hypothetical protein